MDPSTISAAASSMFVPERAREQPVIALTPVIQTRQETILLFHFILILLALAKSRLYMDFIDCLSPLLQLAS